MSHNDVGILNMSKLCQYMEDILYPNYVMAGRLLPALFGDAIFMNLYHVTILAKYDIVGNAEADYLIKKLNYRMSGKRQSIEHIYGALFNFFHLFEVKRQFKIFHVATSDYHLGVIGLFTLNCYTCFNGSACNSMFDSLCPTIQEYLPLDEELVPYIDADNAIYNFYVLD
jgi:hypothetical protein